MRWMGVLNLTLASITAVSCLLFLLAGKQEDAIVFVRPMEQKELPKSFFSQTDEFFQEVGESLFVLKNIPFQMQLPDLRSTLLFYGKNERPDFSQDSPSFLFSLKGSSECVAFSENEKVYLVYKGSSIPKEPMREQMVSMPRPLWGELADSTDQEGKGTYVFSPDNLPTPLWFTAKSLPDQKVGIQITMLDERGALVATPSDLHFFCLHPTDQIKAQSQVWELGNYRADPTLLVRQKARWIGPDLFLAKHGGDDFFYTAGKEKIDFLDGDQIYSCFVGAGDFLAWQEGRWQQLEQTQNCPLLVVKKIEEKIISFDLWNKEGTAKIALSLLRSKDNSLMPDLLQEFKFVGAKTWGQFIVEARGEGRMILKPHDWLVFTQEGWQKLDSADKIDAYVEQSLIGPLFILEKMCKKNGKQVLIGHLFNASRTEIKEVELPSSASTPLFNHYHHMPSAPAVYAQPTESRECYR